MRWRGTIGVLPLGREPNMHSVGKELRDLGVTLGTGVSRGSWEGWDDCVVTDETREKLEVSKGFSLELVPDEEWDVANDRYRFSVVDVAQTLHGKAVGSSGHVQMHELATLISWLSWRIDAGWKEMRDDRYDYAVRMMARETLHMAGTMIAKGRPVTAIGPALAVAAAAAARRPERQRAPDTEIDVCEATVLGVNGEPPRIMLEVEDGFGFYLETKKTSAKAAACHIYQRVRVVLVPVEGP